MLVLGDREVEARTVAPRARNAARGEQQEAVAWDDLADRLAAEAATDGSDPHDGYRIGHQPFG